MLFRICSQTLLFQSHVVHRRPFFRLQGDPFVVGVAYWPGTTIEQWGSPYNASGDGFPGLNPCLGDVTYNNQTENYQAYLAKFGVMISTFAVKVDTLSVLRSTRAEEDQLFDAAIALAQANSAFSKVLSIIAFRGTVRSEVKYIRSDQPSVTGGTGVVDQLALLLVFDRGNLTGFEWYDFGSCEDCGGLNGANCISTSYNAEYQKYPMSTCASPLEDCTCRGLQCASNNCTTSIYTGARGSSQSGQAFTSAYQIQNINRFSISGVFAQAFKALEDLFSSTDGTINSPGDVSQSTDSQQIDPNSDQALYDETTPSSGNETAAG